MVAMILTSILLLGFFGWGVYTLNRRLRYRDEFSLTTELITLSAVLIFYVLEIDQLRDILRGSLLLQMFGAVTLFVSGIALYGHMIISFGTRLLVETVSQGEDFAPDQPRFGPAETLERQHDYAGALQQYLVLARIFPSHAAVSLRVAQCHIRLEHPTDSVPWFQRALRFSQDQQERVLVLNQFCEALEAKLDDRQTARHVILAHLEQYPNCPSAASLHRRVERLSAEKETLPDRLELTRLDEAPLEVASDEGGAAPHRLIHEAISLEAAGTPLGLLEDDEPDEAGESGNKPSSLALEAIETPFSAPEEDEDSRRNGNPSIGLDAL